MSKKNGKAMSNLPTHYIQAMEELQEENNKLRIEIEELKQVKKLNIDDVRLCLGCDTKLESTSENKYYCPNMECSCDFQ